MSVSKDLHFLNQACQTVHRSLRQHDRLQQAWSAYVLHEERLTSGRPSTAWYEADSEVEDHIYYFVVVTSQAIRARDAIVRRGEPLTDITQREELLSWRNIEEHWDDEAVGKVLRSRARWKAVSTESEPGLSRTSGGAGLFALSGVNLPVLVRELRTLSDVLDAASERAWEDQYLTAERARELLGWTVEEFEERAHEIRGAELGEYGMRYLRESVESLRTD